MQPSTSHERFIQEQVSAHLRVGEEIHCYGYVLDYETHLEEPSTEMAGGWLLALTTDRLIRVQTSAGPLTPDIGESAVAANELDDIDSVWVDEVAVIGFKDGSFLTLTLDTRMESYIPSQARLIAILARQFPERADGEDVINSDDADPKWTVTSAILTINVIVFVLMVLDGVSLWSPKTAQLVDWGANFGPRTTGGEGWRLLTSTFVHIGIIHIGFNMWVLSDLGKVVERLVGPVGFLGMYVVSGLCGSIASTWWNPMVVSAGASGAVFGTAGAFGAIILLSRGIIPPGRVAEMKSSIGGFIVYNLIFGFSIPGIDQAAHIGGLLAGAICGAVLAEAASLEPSRSRTMRGALMSIVALPLAIGLATLLPNDVSDPQAALEELAQVERRLLSQLDEARKRNATDEEVSILIESEVQPAWRRMGRKLEGLKGLPDRLQKRIDGLIQFIALRDESWTLMVQAERQGQPSLFEEALEKEREAQSLIRSISTGR